MHLLAAQPGAIEDGADAVDLGQSPGEIVLLSAADTELACFAQAQARLGAGAPTLRLANLLQLGHNLSVDRYAEQVVVGRAIGDRAALGRRELLALRRRAADRGLHRARHPHRLASRRRQAGCRAGRARHVGAGGGRHALALLHPGRHRQCRGRAPLRRRADRAGHRLPSAPAGAPRRPLLAGRRRARPGIADTPLA